MPSAGEHELDDTERATIRRDFNAAVNMTPRQLEDWLETEDSRSVGWVHEGETEAVGHKAGRRIVEIRQKRQADLTDDDYRQMRKVVGYVHRHRAQGPSGDVEHSRWRYSLMNWGHDPMKDQPVPDRGR
jgi:hypothetical protein